MNPPLALPSAVPGELIESLRKAGLIRSDSPGVIPLTGGVSSEIYLIADRAGRFVVKRALAKLRVRDDWFADTARNHSEVAFLRYVGARFPAAVPRILASDPAAGYGLVKLRSRGKPRRLADFDAAVLVAGRRRRAR